MTIESLKALQKRVREATGPDRELDWLILSNVSMPWLADKARSWLDDPYVEIDGRISDPEEICWISREDGKRRYEHCAHYTTDPDGLGACVALMRKVLPSKNAHITLCKTWCRVILTREEGKGKTLHEMVVASPERADDHVCLTYCDAIIAAKIAELEAEQEKEKADV